MTPMERLSQHIAEMHQRPPQGLAGYTCPDLRKYHIEQHQSNGTDHDHPGQDLGPGRRPRGWYSGEDPRPKTPNPKEHPWS